MSTWSSFSCSESGKGKCQLLQFIHPSFRKRRLTPTPFHSLPCRHVSAPGFLLSSNVLPSVCFCFRCSVIMCSVHVLCTRFRAQCIYVGWDSEMNPPLDQPRLHNYYLVIASSGLRLHVAYLSLLLF